MSKTITIPPCRNPFTVIINGIRYEYNSGEVVVVPDEVAEVIQFHVDSKPVAEPIPGGDDTGGDDTGGDDTGGDDTLGDTEGDNAAGGGSNNISAFDYIITSEEQFLAERAHFARKKVLFKDVNLSLATIDLNGAAYVEFCNAAVGSATYTCTIKNFKIGNFIGIETMWESDGNYYGCDDLTIMDFYFVENLLVDDTGIHGGGNNIMYYNGYGIMNCTITVAVNCCNITNCHIIGRGDVGFTNCASISNLHCKNFTGSSFTFTNCTHLSNIALDLGERADYTPVTYDGCSNVCADTCYGYSG